MRKIQVLAGLIGVSAALWLGLRTNHGETFEDVPGAPEGVPARAPEKRGSGVDPELAAALRSGKTEDKERALNVLLPKMLREDLPAAAKLAEALETWAWREEVLHQVARQWAEEDFAAAVKWAVNLRDPQERQTAVSDACVQAAAADPEAAVRKAASLHLGLEEAPVMENLLGIWAAKDPEAAEGWLKEQPQDEARDRQYARLALELSKTAPEDAANVAVKSISPGPAQDEAVMAVLHQWAKRDPQGAVAWVADFPESDLRTRAEEELAGLTRAP
ncbi:MAG: hypothetical protein JWO82_3170 [Akkermansiaceae bacterium]|nr:hypothetical protein [Akkermansiaceae bacterium]